MQKIIKEEGKRNSCIMYTAWGGTNKELRNADLLRKCAEQFRKIEVRQRFEIGLHYRNTQWTSVWNDDNF